MTVPLQPRYVTNNVDELLNLMGTFNRVKNKQIEELNIKIED